jgi:hypothetical protein
MVCVDMTYNTFIFGPILEGHLLLTFVDFNLHFVERFCKNLLKVL